MIHEDSREVDWDYTHHLKRLRAKKTSDQYHVGMTARYNTARYHNGRADAAMQCTYRMGPNIQ